MRVVSSSSIDIQSSPVLVTGLVGIEGHAVLAWSGNIEAGVETARSESLIAIQGPANDHLLSDVCYRMQPRTTARLQS